MSRIALRTRALRTFTLVLAGLCVLVMGSCRRSAHDSALHRDATTKIYPRYWLCDTELRPLPGDKLGFKVKAPVLVELLPNGRVRSLARDHPAFEGLLPEDMLQQPQENRGLMLHAQRLAELHWQSADGPVIGHLHPGAFVSVAPTQNAMVQIGSLPFKDEGKTIVAFAERASLGTTPIKPLGMKPNPSLRSVRWHKAQLTIWSIETDPLKMQPIATTVPCVDIWMSRDAKRISQYVNGVELFGALDSVTAPWPALQDFTDRCAAHAVSRQGEKLAYNGPTPSESISIVDRIPDGYRAYHPLDNDPLRYAVLHSGRVFWLIDSRTGPRCDEWRFERAARPEPAGPIESRLVRREKLDGLTAIHPISYFSGDHGKPPILHLGTIKFSDGATLKCECTTDYALLYADGDELELMSRPIPDQLVAYDPGETERWFLSMQACQRARDEAVRTLARDGTTAVQLGFHAVVNAFEI